MRYTLCLLLLLIVGCSEPNQSIPAIDTFKYTADDSLYITEHLGIFKTQHNNTIEFKVFNGYYNIHWIHNGIDNSFPDSFIISDWALKHFRIIGENNDYILLRASCGNPCHICFVLPFNNTKPIKIQDCIYSDVNKHYIVYAVDTSSIGIYNIISLERDTINIGKCESLFPGYCIDSMYFNNDTLFYLGSENAKFKGWTKIKI